VLVIAGLLLPWHNARKKGKERGEEKGKKGGVTLLGHLGEPVRTNILFLTTFQALRSARLEG